MSWNVQNLFDAVDDGNEYPEFDPGKGSWNERLYQRRLERSAEVILCGRSAFPDLVILQELEKPGILDDLADGALSGCGYHWRLSIPGYSIIRCGILSRYPLSRVEVIDCGSYGRRSLRPALAFSVETPGGSLRVIAGHWKSPRSGRAATEGARRREAGITLEMAGRVLQSNPEAEILIIGDLNTSGDGMIRPAALAPWNPDIQPESDQGILYHSDVPQDAGICDGVPVFFDPEPDSLTGSPGSYWYHDTWDRPDRALLSRGLLETPGLIFKSCRTVPDIAGDKFGRPVRWVSDWEEGYSDHLPLYLEFSIAAENE